MSNAKESKGMNEPMQTATTEAAPALAEIARAAVTARTPEEAAGVNDMVALRLGARHERFVADRAGNLALLTTPGDPDQKSLEPITNMHDTLLERFAHERYGDLSKVKAQAPKAAVAELMGQMNEREQADLARVDIYEAEAPAKRTKRVTLVYRDKGCGLTNRCGLTNTYIPESIFHAGSQHKDAHPWMSGAFGLGATTCYTHAQFVVLVTRRQPSLLKDGEEDLISVAIAEWQQHAKGRGIYYLVDPATKLPLAVAASEVPEFEPGTQLAFVSYETSGFHAGRNDRSSMEFPMNTRLWDAPLPVRHMNHVATGDHPKDHQGRRRGFANPRPDRRDLHGEMPFRLAGSTYRLPIDVHYFEAGPSADKGGMRNFVAQDHAVMLVANGQVHKHWDSQELKYRAERLPKLHDRMLVVVYLDEIPVEGRTGRLFTPDRVDLVKNDDANRLQDQIAAFLNSWLTGERDGAGERPRKKWAAAHLWPDPTTLEGPLKVTAVPGKTKFLYFHVNAEDDFFASGRGKLEVACDHPRVGDAELVPGTELHRGLVRVSLLVPEDVEPGDATITTSVTGWAKAAGGVGDDLQWLTKLEILDAAEKKEQEQNAPPKDKQGSSTSGPLVALIWRKSDDFEDWDGGVPGHVESVEAEVLAETVDEYKELAAQGSTPVPTIYLNDDYTPLKKYESWRAKSVGIRGLDDARDRYAVATGVGMLVLYEREVTRTKAGKAEPDAEDARAERQAVARAALAMMPDIDKLMREAGLEQTE